MKASILAKRIISVMALLLAVMMMFTACGGGDETESSSNASTQSNGETANNNSETDDPVASDPANETDSTPSGNNGTGSTPSGGSVNPGDGWGTAPKGEVHVLMWRNYTKTEKSLVDGYMKKTGIKVRTTVTTEKEYATKLVSLVSGNDSPDVVCFSSGHFPGLVVKSMQSLNEKTFRLNDDCWYKAYMEPYKVNGKYFGVAMNKSWSCEDCAYVTYYNPAVLKQCGVSTMPYQLYTQGKWNWDEQAKIAKKVAQFGKGNFTGLSMQSNDIYMYSAGTDFATYNGKKFSNALGSVGTNSLLTKAWKEVATLHQTPGVTGSWDLTNVQQGKVGLFSAIAYGLYNEGAWFDNVTGGYGSLQAVPVAGPKGGTAYTPVRPKVWGVAKKAKNAEGAAYFLRYFLDVNNCNLSSTFYNKQFETVFNKITAKTAKKQVMVGMGIVDYVKSGTYSSICTALGNASPSAVTTVLNSKKGSVKSAVDRANKDLARVK